MDNFLVNAGSYLISTIIDLYIIIVLLRFLLQIVRADFYNPLSQFIVSATDPVLKPLRKVIPGLLGFDIASLSLAYILQVIENSLLFALKGMMVNPLFLLWHSIGSLITLLLYLYLFAILIQVVVSWLNPGNYNPATAIIHSISQPIIRPVRQFIPLYGGIDLSPVIVILLLNILIMFVPVIFG